MKTILQFASGIALISWTLIAQADELNLRPGVTDISRQGTTCTCSFLYMCGNRRCGLWRTILVGLCSPQVKGSRSRAISSQHETRDCMDHRANHHSSFDGHPVDPGVDR